VPIGPAGTEGFDLLPANSGMAGFADLEAEARNLLREKLNPLAERYDFFSMDVGAGISPMALSFGAMTAIRVVVITPEPTSLTDSYALMKVLSSTHDVTKFHLLVNQVESHAEGKQTYNRLATVCERFLGFRPEYLGAVRSDRQVSEAVRKQKPFSQVNPKSPASEDCMKIAEKLRDLRREMLEKGSMPEPLRDLAQQRKQSA
jgi:flagellar biosynthesis protein FlhG